MEFSAATWWWILCGALVAVELLTGSVYLLMLAVGAGAGALAVHAGLGFTAQMVTAAITGGGATAAWHFKRARHPKSAPAASNPDVNLDIGQTVHVDAWAADGTARVSYRGASWTVRHAGPGAARLGEHLIVAVHGNRLDVAPAINTPNPSA